MDGMLYERQKRLVGRNGDSVAVIGCGGVGNWLALGLAMSGMVAELSLVDPDVLEESNRNRVFARADQVGQAKTKVVAEVIAQVRPEVTIWEFNVAATAGTLPSLPPNTRTIFDCTDRQASQVEIYNYCQAAGIKYVRAGYDGNGITTAYEASGWATDDGQGYTTPSWVIPAMMCACLAVVAQKYGHVFNGNIAKPLENVEPKPVARRGRITSYVGKPEEAEAIMKFGRATVPENTICLACGNPWVLHSGVTCTQSVLAGYPKDMRDITEIEQSIARGRPMPFREILPIAIEEEAEDEVDEEHEDDDDEVMADFLGTPEEDEAARKFGSAIIRRAALCADCGKAWNEHRGLECLT